MRRTRKSKRDDMWRDVNRVISSFNVKHGTSLRLNFNHQRGGATLDVSGFQYYYRDEQDGYEYRIFAGRGPGKRWCILLMYDSVEKIASLHTFERGSDCSMTPGATTQNGLLAAIALAKKYGARRLELTDESRKHLSKGKNFDLSLMYFLSTGKTWYETYIPGLQPKLPIQVGFWREYASTNTWNDVWAALTRRKPDAVLPVDISDIDGGVPGSAMRVFQRIKDARTEFFVDYDQYLTDATRVGPLNHSEWYLMLT